MENGINVIVSYLENKDRFAEELKNAKDLKSKGELVLGISILPISSAGEKVIVDSIERASILNKVVDGNIILNKDSIADNKELNLEETEQCIDREVSEITRGIDDLLQSGVPRIDANTLTDVISSCGTFSVTRGVGEGRNRVEDAFKDAFKSPFYSNFNMDSARRLLIKVISSEQRPISPEEEIKLRKLISNLPKNIDTILSVGNSNFENDRIEIVMLATGLDSEIRE